LASVQAPRRTLPSGAMTSSPPASRRARSNNPGPDQQVQLARVDVARHAAQGGLARDGRTGM
jgi:hypothetical protein